MVTLGISIATGAKKIMSSGCAAPVAKPMAHATSRTAASGSSYFIPSSGLCLSSTDSADPLQHTLAPSGLSCLVQPRTGFAWQNPRAICWFVNLTCNTLGLRGRHLVMVRQTKRYITSCMVLACTSPSSCLKAEGSCQGMCGMQRIQSLSNQNEALHATVNELPRT